MSGMFDKQAAQYAWRRPKYPDKWFSMLASLTPHHKLAWDAGTGSGQAALALAEHYDQVIATDVSQSQLHHAAQHPKVRYLHHPVSTSEDELVAMLSGDHSIDLVVSAAAVHWFDLPLFYSVVNRVLKKPHGIIAVWTYNYNISPLKNSMQMVTDALLQYTDPRPIVALDNYNKLPFPFESFGYGSEGSPMELEMELETTYDEFVEYLRTGSAFVTAKEQGVDLLSDEILEEMKREWGDADRRKLLYSVYMLVGKLKSPA